MKIRENEKVLVFRRPGTSPDTDEAPRKDTDAVSPIGGLDSDDNPHQKTSNLLLLMPMPQKTSAQMLMFRSDEPGDSRDRCATEHAPDRNTPQWPQTGSVESQQARADREAIERGEDDGMITTAE